MTKTVCKYFNEWSIQILKDEDRNFVQRQKEAKYLAILNLDRIIFEVYDLLQEINDEIKKLRKDGKTVPKHLISTKFLLLREIASMTQEKFAITMSPAIDESVEEIIKNYRN
jgi:hypothetical protein